MPCPALCHMEYVPWLARISHMVSGICWVLHMGIFVLVPSFSMRHRICAVHCASNGSTFAVLTELPQAKVWGQDECEGADLRCTGRLLECSRAFFLLLCVQSDQGFMFERLLLCLKEAPEEATPGLPGVPTVAKWTSLLIYIYNQPQQHDHLFNDLYIASSGPSILPMKSS